MKMILIPIVFLFGIINCFGAEWEASWSFPIRGRLIAQDGCDKYCWSQVLIVEHLGGGQHFVAEGTTIAVASISGGESIPSGESILHLERYGQEEDKWKLASGSSGTAVHSLSKLQGLTPGQCKDLGGRIEGDYDKGCSDTEVCPGSVRFMMCPCSCCVPSTKQTPIKSLQDLPPPGPELYAETHDLRQWRNPFLIVESKGIKILHRDRSLPDKLIQRLRRLPLDAWPYGKVVAVRDSLPRGQLRKFEKPVAETADVIRLLREAGLEVVEWPRAE